MKKPKRLFKNGRATASDSQDRAARKASYDRKSTAVHVAAHAVAGFKLDGRVADASIGPGGGQHVGRSNDGAMYLSRNIQECQLLAARGEDAVMPVLVVLLAGRVAEDALIAKDLDDDTQNADDEPTKLLAQIAACYNDPKAGCFTTDGQRIDIIEAIQKLVRFRLLVSDSAWRAIRSRAVEKARQFVAEHRNAILAVADALFSKAALTGAEVAAIVGAHERKSV
jgi:ATP-dependent Zn protease